MKDIGARADVLGVITDNLRRGESILDRQALGTFTCRVHLQVQVGESQRAGAVLLELMRVERQPGQAEGVQFFEGGRQELRKTKQPLGLFKGIGAVRRPGLKHAVGCFDDYPHTRFLLHEVNRRQAGASYFWPAFHGLAPTTRASFPCRSSGRETSVHRPAIAKQIPAAPARLAALVNSTPAVPRGQRAGNAGAARGPRRSILQ